MKTFKFLSVIATAFLIILSYLMLTVPNPLDQQYDSLVQKIMMEKKFHSEQEALNEFPELKTLKSQIQDIKQMQYDIQQTTQNPMPPKKEESSVLIHQAKKLKLMQKEVYFQMEQILDEITAEKTVVQI